MPSTQATEPHPLCAQCIIQSRHHTELRRREDADGVTQVLVAAVETFQRITWARLRRLTPETGPLLTRFRFEVRRVHALAGRRLAATRPGWRRAMAAWLAALPTHLPHMTISVNPVDYERPIEIRYGRRLVLRLTVAEARRLAVEIRAVLNGEYAMQPENREERGEVVVVLGAWALETTQRLACKLPGRLERAVRRAEALVHESGHFRNFSRQTTQELPRNTKEF